MARKFWAAIRAGLWGVLLVPWECIRRPGLAAWINVMCAGTAVAFGFWFVTLARETPEHEIAKNFVSIGIALFLGIAVAGPISSIIRARNNFQQRKALAPLAQGLIQNLRKTLAGLNKSATARTIGKAMNRRFGRLINEAIEEEDLDAEERRVYAKALSEKVPLLLDTWSLLRDILAEGRRADSLYGHRLLETQTEIGADLAEVRLESQVGHEDQNHGFITDRLDNFARQIHEVNDVLLSWKWNPVRRLVHILGASILGSTIARYRAYCRG